METPKALISDADGTLINTLRLIRHGLHETTKTYFETVGIPSEDIPSYEEYEVYANQAVGASARHTIERAARLLYENQPHHLHIIDFDALHSLLDPIQDKIAPEFVKPYAGLSLLLHTLGRSGIKLAIFTSGSSHHIVRNFGVALPELGLQSLSADKTMTDGAKLDMFEATAISKYGLAGFTVVTCEASVEPKPNPESLNLAMQRLGVTAAESVVLGDHKVDMQAGINAGVAMRVGITHGFDNMAVLKAAGATDIVGSLAELSSLLAK